MRFRLRTLLIVVTAIASCIGFALWWTSPAVKRMNWMNGNVAEEIWYCRTLRGETRHLATVRYHENGQKAYQWWVSTSSSAQPGEGHFRLWLENGSEMPPPVVWQLPVIIGPGPRRDIYQLRAELQNVFNHVTSQPTATTAPLPPD